MTRLYGSMAFMSTLCSWSPMRNTLQRRPSSLSSKAEYCWTDSTPFWSSSVVLGLGRSSKMNTPGFNAKLDSSRTWTCCDQTHFTQISFMWIAWIITYISARSSRLMFSKHPHTKSLVMSWCNTSKWAGLNSCWSAWWPRPWSFEMLVTFTSQARTQTTSNMHYPLAHANTK